MLRPPHPLHPTQPPIHTHSLRAAGTQERSSKGRRSSSQPVAMVPESEPFSNNWEPFKTQP